MVECKPGKRLFCPGLRFGLNENRVRLVTSTLPNPCADVNNLLGNGGQVHLSPLKPPELPAMTQALASSLSSVREEGEALFELQKCANNCPQERLPPPP